MPTPVQWRRWHRWLGTPAALFMAFASITGVLVAGTEFFGEDEALREANRRLVSPVTTTTATAQWTATLPAVIAGAAREAPGAPVDRITIEFKGQAPVTTVYLGKPGGGEEAKLRFDGRTGSFLRREGYADKPLIHRIHSGEIFGDGGLVASMVWGLALLGLTISGWYVYLRMLAVERAGRTGWRRFFF